MTIEHQMVEFNILCLPFINCPISMAQNLETMSSLKRRWDWTDGSHSASSRFQYENWHRRAWRVTDHWPKIGSARAPPFPGSRLPLSLVSDNQTDRGRRLQRNPAEELESTTHRRPDRKGFYFFFTGPSRRSGLLHNLVIYDAVLAGPTTTHPSAGYHGEMTGRVV